MTSSLAALQRRFQRHVLTSGGSMAADVESGNERDADLRLGIYHSAYRLRLSEALSKDFPKLHTMLGGEAFNILAAAYIAGHPSHDPNIRWLGRRLPGFLTESAGYRDEPVLGELAGFEQALHDAFDAADEPVLTTDALAAVAPTDWPHLRVVPHPSVRRLDLTWNTVQIWQTQDRGQSPPNPG